MVSLTSSVLLTERKTMISRNSIGISVLMGLVYVLVYHKVPDRKTLRTSSERLGLNLTGLY